MDYDKKYNEALERAKKWEREHPHGYVIKDMMEYIFPELAESEDERMMREFNDWLCDEIECRTNDLRDEEDRRTLNMLCYILTKVKDWHEKQKEQKPKYCHHDVDETGWTEEYRKAYYDGWNNCNMQHEQLKDEQKPAEWSEEDEEMLNLTKTQLRILQSYLSHTHSENMSDMEYPSQLLQIEKCVSWLDVRFKSLRPQPIQLKEAYKDGFQTARHAIALAFMNYLDENRSEGKMSLSNGECEDIDKAFKEGDWAKIMRYYEKYRPSWKPSEEQMEALCKASDLLVSDLNSLYNDLKKLM